MVLIILVFGFIVFSNINEIDNNINRITNNNNHNEQVIIDNYNNDKIIDTLWTYYDEYYTTYNKERKEQIKNTVKQKYANFSVQNIKSGTLKDWLMNEINGGS